MAEGENLGAKFSIDISDLKAGLAQANRLMKESNSEFKAAAAGMDDWSKSEDGLNAKLKQLSKTLEVQEGVLSAYEKQYEEAGYAQDDMSAAAVELRTKINNQKAAVAKTRKEISDYTEQLEELTDASEDAEESLEDVGDAAEESGDGFTIAKGAISGFIANGLTSLVGACKNAVSSVLGLAEATREYREDMAKLDTAFSTTGHKTADAQKSYEDFYAILGESDRSVEAINHLAELTSSQEELSKWSTIAAGVTAKFGDSLPIEGLTEAANETAKVGKVTGPLADALNWAGESEDAFNEKLAACNSEQERSQLITNTLNGLYEEAAEKYNEQTKSQQDARRATAEYEAAQAELGDAIEPVTTKLTELKTQGLQWLIDTGLPAAKQGFEWVKENIAPIATLIGGVTTAIIAQNVATKAKAVADLAAASGMTVMKLAQQGLNTAMKANPIGLVITAVTLLITAFVALWKKSEGFRNFWIKLWDGMKKTFVGFVNGVIKGANALIRGINKIKFNIPDWVPAIGGKTFGINIPEIPLLAKGGIVNQATTAVIGENGKEAIVPLERNTEWIDKVADKVASKQPKSVIVNQTNNYSQAHSRYEIYKSKQQTAAAVKLALQGVK